MFGNKLTTISYKMFVQLPGPLFLGLSKPNATSDETWQCDTMCWVKQLEMEGNITFLDPTGYMFVNGSGPCGLSCSLLEQADVPPVPFPVGPETGSFHPNCANQTWSDLSCSEYITCA